MRGRKLSDEHRRRISQGLDRYWSRERKLRCVQPRHLRDLRAGSIAPSVAPFVPLAIDEAQAMIQALGGPEGLTPMRRALIDDLVSAGIVLRAELARYMQSRDQASASRVSALTNARRQSLAELCESVHAHSDVSTTARHYARWAGGDAYIEPLAIEPGEVPADLLARLPKSPHSPHTYAGTTSADGESARES